MKIWIFSLFLLLAYGEAWGQTARIETDQGVIEVVLFGQKAPRSVAHFASLVSSGAYKDTVFHRVVPQALIEAGEPRGQDKAKDIGYCVDDEFHEELIHDAAGMLSFVSDGEDSVGHQFAITLKPVRRLNKRYSVFGRVTSGMDVVQKMAGQDVLGTTPVEPVHIKRITVDGPIPTIAVERRTKLTDSTAPAVVDAKAESLLKAIGKNQSLGKLRSFALKSVLGRCGQAQLVYDAQFEDSEDVSLLIYGQSTGDSFLIRQFQYTRGTL